MDSPLAIFLMGPTASGKTDLAVYLAQQLPLDIISVDSTLVYRDMDIGSAKPDLALRQQYPHALIDIRDPDQTYCAGDFRRDALVCMQQSWQAGRIPLLVGGTGLYFRALEQGLAEIPAIDPAIRLALAARAAAQGQAAMFAELQQLDPTLAARLYPEDRQRTLRALEVYQATGQRLSEWQQQTGAPPLSCPIFKIALMPARELLHERIAQRLRAMLSGGFVEEVAALATRGYAPTLPAMRAVGYRQLWPYISGECSLAQASEAALYATRQLAKRQLTWLRRERLDQILTTMDYGAVADAIYRFIVGEKR